MMTPMFPHGSATIPAATGMAQGPSTANVNPAMFAQMYASGFGTPTYGGPQTGHVLSQSEGYFIFPIFLMDF